MTAQQQGLATIGSVVRKLVPPQLDFVVIVYPAEGPLNRRLAFVTSTGDEDNLTSRAVDAAAVFVTERKNDQRPTGGN